ncbi:unnamed protein product [Pleuronectes platessa]|uniref:Uncharacterized protein n=1 Tax=Pleuronectes platessa TaxID=8262 RepID=A0A9N7ZCR1_PLEPL|nr:unnamed protein product [Pleuronectes platessa]
MFIFVVKPLGTCRGWGSSPSVALLSAPPEAQCAAPGGPHPVAPHGVTGGGAFFLLYRGAVSIAGAEGGPLEGTGYAIAHWSGGSTPRPRSLAQRDTVRSELVHGKQLLSD